MRIIAGRWKGRALLAPEGARTRPTGARARQALFDMLWHAPWAGRARVEGARVLDAFAGTGALGLEALSRGAAHADFLENDPAALLALRANARDMAARIWPADGLRPPRAPQPCTLAFLDPPYGKGLVPAALAALGKAGWIAPGALVCAELGPGDEPPAEGFETLATRGHGPATWHILSPS